MKERKIEIKKERKKERKKEERCRGEERVRKGKGKVVD